MFNELTPTLIELPDGSMVFGGVTLPSQQLALLTSSIYAVQARQIKEAVVESTRILTDPAFWGRFKHEAPINRLFIAGASGLVVGQLPIVSPN